MHFSVRRPARFCICGVLRPEPRHAVYPAIHTVCHVTLRAHLRHENIYDTSGRCVDAEDSVIFHTPLHVSFND